MQEVGGSSPPGSTELGVAQTSGGPTTRLVGRISDLPLTRSSLISRRRSAWSVRARLLRGCRAGGQRRPGGSPGRGRHRCRSGHPTSQKRVELRRAPRASPQCPGPCSHSDDDGGRLLRGSAGHGLEVGLPGASRVRPPNYDRHLCESRKTACSARRRSCTGGFRAEAELVPFARDWLLDNVSRGREHWLVVDEHLVGTRIPDLLAARVDPRAFRARIRADQWNQRAADCRPYESST